MIQPRLAFAILLVAIASPRVAHSIVLSDRDQNHVVTPSEPMYGVNLDGVVALGNGEPGSTTFDEIVLFNCTGALITDRHVLTAAHCVDEDRDGEVDSFVRGFPYVAGFQLSGGGRLIQVNTDAIHLPTSWPNSGILIGDNIVGGEDIAVLELLEPAPPEIPRYPLYGGRDELGAAVVLTGYGSTGVGDTGVEEEDATVGKVKRAGQNRLEAFFDEREIEMSFDFDSGAPEHNTLAFLGYDSDLGFGTDEVLTAQGDSGAPLFWDVVIVGVNSFNVGVLGPDYNDEFDQSWGEVGFAIRVSRFQDFIMAATGGEAVFVPEPDCMGLVASLLICGRLRRKR